MHSQKEDSNDLNVSVKNAEKNAGLTTSTAPNVTPQQKETIATPGPIEHALNIGFKISLLLAAAALIFLLVFLLSIKAQQQSKDTIDYIVSKYHKKLMHRHGVEFVEETKAGSGVFFYYNHLLL